MSEGFSPKCYFGRKIGFERFFQKNPIEIVINENNSYNEHFKF